MGGQSSGNNSSTEKSGEKRKVLEFYHGYHHSESEWPVAKVMRDIYDKFAKEHANGNVEFKPIPVNGDLKIS